MVEKWGRKRIWPVHVLWKEVKLKRQRQWGKGWSGWSACHPEPWRCPDQSCAKGCVWVHALIEARVWADIHGSCYHWEPGRCPGSCQPRAAMLVSPRAILIWVAWAAMQGHSDIRAQIAAKTMSESMVQPQPGLDGCPWLSFPSKMMCMPRVNIKLNEEHNVWE